MLYQSTVRQHYADDLNARLIQLNSCPLSLLVNNPAAHLSFYFIKFYSSWWLKFIIDLGTRFKNGNMSAGTRGIVLLEWMVSFTVICAIMLFLRFWAASLQKRKIYADDWMVLIAFVSTSLTSEPI